MLTLKSADLIDAISNTENLLSEVHRRMVKLPEIIPRPTDKRKVSTQVSVKSRLQKSVKPPNSVKDI